MILSAETVADRYSYAIEVCMIILGQWYEQEEQIGGTGKIIEVNNTKICQRKYGPEILRIIVLKYASTESVIRRLYSIL